ncbi:lasso peptide biosynthesis B2 protein [Sphingomonas sp. 22R3R2A-7]|uniref:lasso peptide biosynthesis B2 protein n=1 Tax=Sphingomonas sp. 22R3R2A-7 TaxID=3050230 RepID=UPI002FE14D24
MSDPGPPAASASPRDDRYLANQLRHGRALAGKLHALSGADAVALAEAIVLLGLAAPLIRLVPFRTIAAAMSTPIGSARHDAAVIAATVERVAWAIDRSAKRVPTRALCFERGLAAHLMLRRRGIDSTLVYGVAPGGSDGSVLRAHVWVHVDSVEVTGGGDLTGGDDLTGYAPLASFPSGRTHTGPLRPRPPLPAVHERDA